MENWPGLMGVAALAVLCDRMLGWMERRGWIYWRHQERDLRGSAMAAARGSAPRWGERREPRRHLRPAQRPLRRLGGRPRPRA
jgi:hypothetical protein